MSTATGPAYRLKPNTDLFSVSKHLDEVREAQSIAITQEFFDGSVFMYDYSKEEQTYTDFLYNYTNKLHQELKEENDHYALTRALNPILLFNHNPVRDEIYVRLVNFVPNAQTLFAQLPFVDKNMEYYNGSDAQLSEMSEEEWHDLRDAWDELNLQSKKYSESLKLELINPLFAKYENLGSKILKQRWDQIQKPKLTERYKRKFLDLYFSNLENVDKQDPLQAIISSTNYSYSKNTIEDLFMHEKYSHKVEELRNEAEEFIHKRPIELK
jgi:hypothetical protein